MSDKILAEADRLPKIEMAWQPLRFSGSKPIFFYVCVAYLLIAIHTLQLRAQNSSLSDGFIRADRLGIAHISAPGDLDSSRYLAALELGAGWNRWPLYWDRVQTAADSWDWQAYDQQVAADFAARLEINAILLGRPEFYADDEAQITGLYAPIFANGGDLPSDDKALNPENPWAQFVYEAVNRYKPGGLLATQLGLPENSGIRVWEVWNEPDFRQFWRGSFEDYARLLKVAYIVAKQADPQAQIMFGGLLYNTNGVNWLAQVLRIYSRDSLAPRFNTFMDIVAVHNYGNPWRSGWLVQVVRDSLIAYGIERPIWLNETGVPVWDDYPGPTWESGSIARVSSQQQAWFFIQSAVFAWAEGADKVFYHQLFDDCGNQPAGTDFAPNAGMQCGGTFCVGDAFGLYRNPSGAACFRQSPQPGTARPAAAAYRLVAEVFGSADFTPLDHFNLDNKVRAFTFNRPERDERITVVWNTSFEPVTFSVEAVGEDAQLIRLDAANNQPTLINPVDGTYMLILPAAQPDNIPDAPPGQDAAIGGEPLIMIERLNGRISPVAVASEFDSFVSPDQPLLVPTNSPMLEASFTPTMAATIPPTEIAPTAIPTLSPVLDTTPPLTGIAPLAEVSPTTFTVIWGGQDDTTIVSYIIWVRENNGEWTVWLDTSITSTLQNRATFIGTSGSIYEFAAWAVDLNGNWSSNIQLQPQAITRVQ